ncbi:hypothetical protein VSS74_26195 [Conexibacter stalactiti]|uniref:RCC1-like domain-containing protein n=1 Tax=Conexibacter stalactiti TaxID=1940611 RepID=A0ABU4HX28_9ACTN|nr:hypothetical protein [Conexibacter stalactiti]MDW5597872.1 hypothetical protein [Conexibacter stalactiti]MEC5038514.1 hypothetical protein [Conexibacter stalactiti]
MLTFRRRARGSLALLALLLTLLAGAILSTAASARTLEAGGDFGCALRDDGQVLCWGPGDRLGRTSPDASLSAVPVDALGDAVDLATGESHACAVRGNGAVACWGDDSAGQLGDDGSGGDYVPVPVNGVANAAAVTAGDQHSCALLRDGTVSCWGSDAVGQSGGYDGLGSVGVVSLDAGARSTCAAINDGTVSCWGLPLALVLSPAITDAVAVAAGDEHACALRRGGTVICWGANDQGQLGLGSTAAPADWRDVPGLGGVTAIAAGGDETCALRGDRTVVCWGSGVSGQLGRGTVSSSPTPVAVAGLTDATAVTVGGAHACALRADGIALCWGDNRAGQLGSDRAASTTTPVAVTGVNGAVAVANGASDHRCAVIHDAGVTCWGANDRGQLGDGTTVDRIVPAAVRGLPLADEVAVGDKHSCALVEVQVSCWGEGENGRLGNGSLSDRATPVTIPGLQAVHVAAGFKSTCAVTLTSNVACWGARYIRETPTEPARWEDLATPAVIAGTSQAVQVVTMDNASCALFVDMTVSCWGLSDYGQLGVGWRSVDFGSTDPVPVTYESGTPLAGVDELFLDGRFSICAELADESFACWGDHHGNYARTVALSAPPLPDGDGCAVDAGAVRCVGDGAAGQLGDGYQPAGHYPLQPQASPVIGIGGSVRQPAVASRGVTETPPPTDGGGTPPPALVTPPPTVRADPPRVATTTPFAIKRAKAGRNGRIALTLSLPKAGGVRVVATATVGGKRVTWFQTAKAISVKAGARSVAIVPSAAARRALKRAGTAKVSLRVSFTPKGGKAVVRTAVVTVRRS